VARSKRRQFAEARGGVTVVTKDQNASGDLGVYDLKTKTITLTGSVLISQGKNVLHGERVVVDTVAGNVRIESGATAHDRVRALILPTKDANGAPTNVMSFGAPSRSN
jgi:lipopolysaccharide export system protein LptA